MSMRRRWPVVLVLTAGLLSGCASHAWRMEGVGPDGELGREVRYVLASEDGNEGSVTVAARGRVHDEVQGRSTDTVRFWLTLDNASADPITVPTARVAARDDQGRVLTRVATLLPPNQAAEELVVAPHQRTTMELLFDLGAPWSLRSTGSLTLDWSYRFRGKEVEHHTRFIPVRYYGYPGTYYTGFYYYPWYGGFSFCW